MRRTTAAALLAGAAVVALADSGEAQLAPSPWPMFQHDAFHSGRSPLLGPVFNGTTPPPGAVTSAAFIDKIKMHPVIGKDGTIYVGMGWQFCAVNPDLTPKWQGYSASAPGCKRLIGDVSGNAAAIDANGFVYLGDRDNTFYKFHPDTGAIIWTYNNGHEGDIASGPVIVSDGAGSANIYFTFIQNFTGYGVLAKIKQNDLAGPAPNLKWSVAVGQFGTTSSPVVGPNGVIYVGFADGRLYAFNDLGNTATVKWKTTVGIGSITSSPVFEPPSTAHPSGRVYIGSSSGFHALNPDTGAIEWSFPTNGPVGHSAAQGTDGTLYFVSQNSTLRTVYAITPGNTSAQLRWQYAKSVSSTGTGYPIIGGDGIVYVGFGFGVYAFNNVTGQLLWNYNTTNGIISSPAIGLPALCPPTSTYKQCGATMTHGGTAVLIIGSSDHKLYRIAAQRGTPAANLPPSPDIDVSCNGGPCGQNGLTVTTGTEVTFDASGSTDPNGDQLFYTWDFGDNTTASGVLAHHTYWTAGANGAPVNRVVKLSVTDGSATSETQVTLSVSGGGAITFCDNFTRSSYPSESLGSPTTIQPLPCPQTLGSLAWQETPGGDLRITSPGQLENAPLKATHIATLANLSGVDQAAAADFTTTLNSTGPRFGFVFRYTSDKDYYMAYRNVGGASVLRISRVVNGVETILKWVGVVNPIQGTTFRLRGSISGTTLTISLCSTTVTCNTTTSSVSVSDPTFAGGSVGLMMAWGTAGTPVYIADNFKACSGAAGTDCSSIK